MTRIEPPRMHKHVCNRLNGILKMLITLEEDFENCLRERPAYADTDYVNRLMKKSASIRNLRRDAQRMALQAGPKVAEWWAERNFKAIQEAEQ